MTIETIGNRTVITAGNGRFVRRIGSCELVRSVSISPSDSAGNWEDADVETRYSVRAIIRELKAVGKFAAVRQMLESANFDWDFIGSNYLSTNDADFTDMLTAIVTGGILSQAELDALLPKCIWEQTPMT